jgi:hypothetical protein
MTEALGNSTSLLWLISYSAQLYQKINIQAKQQRLFPIKNKCRLKTFCEIFMLSAEILLICSDAGFYKILQEM